MTTTVQVLYTEEEWHEARAKVVATASEAAILIGHASYSSPATLRNKDQNTFKGNAYTLVGQVLEPVVVDVTNRVLGTKFELYEVMNKGKVFYTNGLLGATPDAGEGDVLLECKSTKPANYLKYKEEPPLQYLVQLQVQMHCVGVEEGYLAIMSTDLSQVSQEIIWPITVYKVVQNGDLCAILQTEAERFTQDEKFRVDSKLKKQTKQILDECYTKVFMGEPARQEDNIESLKALMRGSIQR